MTQPGGVSIPFRVQFECGGTQVRTVRARIYGSDSDRCISIKTYSTAIDKVRHRSNLSMPNEGTTLTLELSQNEEAWIKTCVMRAVTEEILDGGMLERVVEEAKLYRIKYALTDPKFPNEMLDSNDQPDYFGLLETASCHLKLKITY